jgi:transposase-like protein
MKNTKAISPEVHAEIVRLAAAGVNTKEIAAQFGISRISVQRHLRIERDGYDKGALSVNDPRLHGYNPVMGEWARKSLKTINQQRGTL